MPITRHLARCHALTIHNREAPVSKLPMELLSKIFHIGLDEYDLDAIEYLSTISSICSVWRDVALGTPLLWRRVIYTDPDHHHDHNDHNPHPKTESPAIPQHTTDRLIACHVRRAAAFSCTSVSVSAISRSRL